MEKAEDRTGGMTNLKDPTMIKTGGPDATIHELMVFLQERMDAERAVQKEIRDVLVRIADALEAKNG